MPAQKIMLVHGIRTQAEWQYSIGATLEGIPGVEVLPVRYEYFDLIRFWLPFRRLRARPVERITRQIREALNVYRDSELSIIAHSFGCYVIGTILSREPDVRSRIKYLVLTGNVLPDDFPWENMTEFDRERVINECGARDFLPVLAKTCTWGYGSSGVFGFGQVRVTDRHHDLSHSQYLTREFAERFWVPLFRDSQLVEGEEQVPKKPLWLSLLTVLPPKAVLPVFLSAALAFNLGGPIIGGRDDEPTLPLLSSQSEFAPLPVPLATSGATATQPAPPVTDERRILYMGDPEAQSREDVYSIAPDGTGVTRLTNVASVVGSSPIHISSAIWSPDGARIAFVSDETGYPEVYVMNPNGTGKQRLSSAGAGVKRIAWAPDSTRLLFEWTEEHIDESTHETLRSIYWVEVSQVGQTPILDPARNIWNASWSHDGAQILYVQMLDSIGAGVPHAQIYAMGSDGTHQHAITQDTNFWNQAPSWSPDGGKIVYSSNQDGQNRLIVLDVATGEQTMVLTKNADDQAAAWSPDGDKLAVVIDGSPKGTEDRLPYYEVAVVNADGSGFRQYTNNDVYDGYITWSVDGTALAFESRGSDAATPPEYVGRLQIWVSELAGTPVQITRAGGHAPSWGR